MDSLISSSLEIISPPSSHFSGGLAFMARRGSSQVVVLLLWLKMEERKREIQLRCISLIVFLESSESLNEQLAGGISASRELRRRFSQQTQLRATPEIQSDAKWLLCFFFFTLILFLSGIKWLIRRSFLKPLAQVEENTAGPLR